MWSQLVTSRQFFLQTVLEVKVQHISWADSYHIATLQRPILRSPFSRGPIVISSDVSWKQSCRYQPTRHAWLLQCGGLGSSTHPASKCLPATREPGQSSPPHRRHRRHSRLCTCTCSTNTVLSLWPDLIPPWLQRLAGARIQSLQSSPSKPTKTRYVERYRLLAPPTLSLWSDPIQPWLQRTAGARIQSLQSSRSSPFLETV